MFWMIVFMFLIMVFSKVLEVNIGWYAYNFTSYFMFCQDLLYVFMNPPPHFLNFYKDPVFHLSRGGGRFHSPLVYPIKPKKYGNLYILL